MEAPARILPVAVMDASAPLEPVRLAVMPTNHPAFLARRTIGQPNYLLIALAAVFLIALAPRGQLTDS
jgi:hypothetical protein